MEIQVLRKGKGLATVLALGTANPPIEILQKDYPDFYSRVTNWDDDSMPQLKEKFKQICEKTRIRKRHMFLTEEFLKGTPEIIEYNASSLDTRQEILSVEVPKLAQEACLNAIEDWGQAKSKITHLIFTTAAGVSMPGYDYHLAKLLDLGTDVQRIMLFQLGCYAGGTILRIAKDIAENNPRARVLVVHAEMIVTGFRGPIDTHMASMVGQAIFTEGAAAAIVGADPDQSVGERPLFELIKASQSFVPETEWAIGGQLRQIGLTYTLSKDNPAVVANNVEKPLTKAFSSLGIKDWNSIFWILHPGGPAILDQVEAKLGLNKDKLRSSRHVLSEFGNMSGASVLFVLDETRKRSLKEGKSTTGEGLEYGVLLGLGPGVTFETVVLRAVPQ